MERSATTDHADCEHLPEVAADRGHSPELALRIWEREYLPLIRFVDVSFLGEDVRFGLVSARNLSSRVRQRGGVFRLVPLRCRAC
jgi:hypothetical protein